MKPKIEAAIDFVENATDPNAHAIIARLQNLTASLNGQSGTRIIRS